MYVEHPHDILAAMRKKRLRYLIVDRTGFVPGAHDILTVQNIPPHIFQASYPSWFFGLESFRASLPEYRAAVEFDSTEGSDWEGSFFKGFVFERRKDDRNEDGRME
jgi:putative methyltransferase (TIGR04325 family)